MIMPSYRNLMIKMRGKIRNRPRPVEITTSNDLWWVKVILNVGRPVVAVIVLVMCAPGEHFLARMAGWSHWLAWGMPATLTAYAGIAAVVATKRPKGSPGKKTAVAGAIISVLLAMGAQPIAHLYERGLITGHQTWLTVIVSCIPALVFGHLLHMAAAPVGQPTEQAPYPVGPEATERLLAAVRNVRPMPVPEDPAVEEYDEQDLDDEETSEPGMDAFRYRSEDEDQVGMDADLDSLRGLHGPRSQITERGDVNGALRSYLDRMTVRDPAPDMWTAPPGTPAPEGPDVPGEWHRVRGWTADMVIRDEVVPADLADTVRDEVAGQPTEADLHALLSRIEDIAPDNGAGQSRTVPDTAGQAPSRDNGTRRRTTGITARVRALLSERPDMTDEEIKNELSDCNPDSVRKSINRVKDET